jgi:hypothetical protein
MSQRGSKESGCLRKARREFNDHTKGASTRVYGSRFMFRVRQAKDDN